MTETRTQNSYTLEQIQELETMVSKHNEGKNFNEAYYIVDLTGDKQVFFTLYRYRKPTAYVNPYKYIKNLSINIVQASRNLGQRQKLDYVV